MKYNVSDLNMKYTILERLGVKKTPYSIGDKVRVAPDLTDGWTHRGFVVSQEMLKYKGKVMTVDGVKEFNDGELFCYTLKECGDDFVWTEEVLDLVTTVEEHPSYTIAHTVMRHSVSEYPNPETFLDSILKPVLKDTGREGFSIVGFISNAVVEDLDKDGFYNVHIDLTIWDRLTCKDIEKEGLGGYDVVA